MSDSVFEDKMEDGWRLVKEGEHARLQTLNRANFFHALSKTAVTSVRVIYSGSLGDSFVDGIEFLDKDAETLNPDGVLTMNAFQGRGGFVNITPENPKGEYKAGEFTHPQLCTFTEAAQMIANNELDERYARWHKDEGASGEFEFFVADERIEWEHREYFTDYETMHHTIEAGSKSKQISRQ